VGQVERERKEISRKGAKAQRKDAKKAFKINEHSTLCELSLRLCAFAGDAFVRCSPKFHTHPLPVGDKLLPA
jgi:hypothetical protein